MKSTQPLQQQGVLDRGFWGDIKAGRVQSVAIGFYTWRWRQDLWKWPYDIDRFKGTTRITVGPLFIEIGG